MEYSEKDFREMANFVNETVALELIGLLKGSVISLKTIAPTTYNVVQYEAMMNFLNSLTSKKMDIVRNYTDEQLIAMEEYLKGKNS